MDEKHPPTYQTPVAPQGMQYQHPANPQGMQYQPPANPQGMQYQPPVTPQGITPPPQGQPGPQYNQFQQPMVNVVPQNSYMQGMQYQQQLFALCAEGKHARKKEFGVCGIITAIALFPFGLICLFLDSHVKCSRCGERLPN